MAEKLKIKLGKVQGSSFSAEKTLEICFNPTEYSISESNDYAEAQIPGLGAPIIQFKQGKARTLSLELMLDTYDTKDASKKDIRNKFIKPLEKAIQVDSDLHAPLFCQIIWGTLNFVGILESLEKKYTLFNKSGIPVRARVTLKVKEYIPLPLIVKNARLSSPDRRKMFTLKDGDDIWQMSYRAYEDPAQWRVIAEANNIDDPLELEPGKDLIIPVLDARDRR